MNPFNQQKKQFKDLQEARLKKAQQKAAFTSRAMAANKPNLPDRQDRTVALTPSTPASAPESVAKAQPHPATLEPESLIQSTGTPFWRDDGVVEFTPTNSLTALSNLYLHAAKYRTKHIALVWPAGFKTLTLAHTLATLSKWSQGNKKGVRGLIYPVKTNAFFSLNHLHLSRQQVFKQAQRLAEVNPNENVQVSLPQKDAFHFALSETSLKSTDSEVFNPTVGELLPHFLWTAESSDWMSCEDKLLALIKAKLARRAHAKALSTNLSFIGNPKTAPDALFAIDGRISEAQTRTALRALAKMGAPEVVIVQATRAVRFETPGWKGKLARFCFLLEQVFGENTPGIIVVTDEPHAAARMKDELWQSNAGKEIRPRWGTNLAYKVRGIPSVVGGDGLVPAGADCSHAPDPRSFEVGIVDADAAKVSARLAKIAAKAPGGREGATPLMEAADFIGRLAALPCGVQEMADYLSGPDISDRTRKAFDWALYAANAKAYEKTTGLGLDKAALLESLEKASGLVGSYYKATPFAHRLASVVSTAALRDAEPVTVVFTNALYRRLAERFLTGYTQYPNAASFEGFADRVHLVPASSFAESLDKFGASTVVFAGLNEECLRIVLSDNRLTGRAVLLLTQRAGQFLRAALEPISERYPEFISFKPRVDSILSQLGSLPEDSSVLTTGDFVLPTFRVELSSELTDSSDESAPDAWTIRFEGGGVQFRRPTSEVYVYDPTSPRAAESGFRASQVTTLEIGDRVFFMSAELREMVEQVLRDAGVPIQSDLTFESALRAYHGQVTRRVQEKFPGLDRSECARALRRAMLDDNPKIEKELPSEQSVKYWIDLSRSTATNFDDLKPQAPMKEAVFKAFANVLGFSSLEAAYQWQRVIMAVRNSRRIDGRHVSDIYAHMLLQPESAMVHSSVRRETLERLYANARENIVIVDSIKQSREEHQ